MGGVLHPFFNTSSNHGTLQRDNFTFTFTLWEWVTSIWVKRKMCPIMYLNFGQNSLEYLLA